MKASTTSISFLRLDNLASRLSSVSIYWIKFYGKRTCRLESLPIRSMMHKTFSKISLSMLLTKYIRILENISEQLATARKSWPLHTAPLYELARLFVLVRYNTSISQNSEKFALNIRKGRARLLPDPSIPCMKDSTYS